MRNRIRVIFITILFFFFVGGCNKQDETKNENVINIGVLVPLTGSATQSGTEVQYLLSLIQDEINGDSKLNLPFSNEKGLPNLDNAEVRFVLGDSSTPDIAMLEAERLITEENVIGLVGSLSSAATKTVMVPAERYGVVLMSEGTSESLAEEGYEFFTRTFPGDDTFVKDTFEYITTFSNTENPIETVALVSEDSEFGANIASLEKKWAEEMGFDIVEDISYSATSSNLTAEVMRLRNANPDAIVMSSYIADALLFMSTFKEQNYFPGMLIGQRGGFASSDFINNLEEDANYVHSTARWSPDIDREIAQELNTLYKEEYSGGIELIGDIMSVGWNAYLLAIAANQAESIESGLIRQELSNGLIIDEEQDPSGLSGYKYEENGQNVFAKAIIIQIKNKKMVTVYPENVAKDKGVYPASNWDNR